MHLIIINSLHLSVSLCILPYCVHVIVFMNYLGCFLFDDDVNLCSLKRITYDSTRRKRYYLFINS